MKILFLGTSGGLPSATRNTTALALQSNIVDDKWSLFDCGDGTTYQIAKIDWTLDNLDSIFITHLHADHFFGILMLLYRKDMYRECCDLTLYAPKGAKEFILSAVKITNKTFMNFKLTMVEIEEGSDMEVRDMRVKVLALKHRIPSYAYHIETKDKRVIISGDNEAPEVLKEYLPNLDLLVHEATFKDEDYEGRESSMHSTAKLLGEVAGRYGVANLIATHFSIRYDDDDMIELSKEIESNYSNPLFLANDLDEFLLEIYEDRASTLTLTS